MPRTSWACTGWVCRGTIEERVLKTLTTKQKLFTEVFEGENDEIPFAAVGRAGFLDAMREMIGEKVEELAAAMTGARVASELTAREPVSLLAAAVQLLEAVAVVLTADQAEQRLTSELRARMAAAAEQILGAANSHPRS